MNAAEWAQRRTFHHSRWDASVLAGQSIAICLPAKECAGTVGRIVAALLELGVEVVVVDAASADGTADVAAAAGARVLQEAALRPDLGPVQGKGDAMWRALDALETDLVCFLDADTEEFSPHFAVGLLGPLVEWPELSFIKAFYRRPLGGRPDGGGRVNHLLARPALSVFFPALGGVRQPLAGEIAARRELLREIPFACGYGVEMAMLHEVLGRVGLAGMAQVDLGEHHNPHRPLAQLEPMAREVLGVVADRLIRQGRLQGTEVMVAERPPHA